MTDTVSEQCCSRTPLGRRVRGRAGGWRRRGAVVSAAVAPSAAGSYAVLQCGEDSGYVHQKYSGYFTVFRALLEEEDETWRVYRAVHGELPTTGLDFVFFF